MKSALAKTLIQVIKPRQTTSFAEDVVKGLSAHPKWLSAKHFYDAEGSRLFERITTLPEYYPTRSETSILRDRAPDIASLIPERSALVEFGSGSTAKIRLLLEAAPKLVAYAPVDISAEYLEEQAAGLRRDFPRLNVIPIGADFTEYFELPAKILSCSRAGFFPGSTIGNFEPLAAVKFLRNAARILGRGAVMIIGVDLVKDKKVLNAAYNDSEGVTAAFNLNLLTRINRELGGDFDLDQFEHRAFFETKRQRIEMHLVSRKPQKVMIGGRAFEFERGETIHTENSYKYTRQGFADLARQAGWNERSFWTDRDGKFSVRALVLKN